MTRRICLSLGVAALIGLGAGAAQASGAPVRLLLSQGAAFNVLGRWCGGISEKVYATGFDAKGFPTSAELLSTSCGGSGRDGGGHTTTYTAWASTEWDWYGETRHYAKLTGSPGAISETFSAEDSHGDHIYNTGTAAYLEAPSPPVQAPEPPTASVSLQEIEEGAQIRFLVGWTLAPETELLITSLHVVAEPVSPATGPTLEATVNEPAYGVYLGPPLERRTTYRITVTNTDREGTSVPSAPVEINTTTPEETREKNLEAAEPQAPEFGRCVKAFHEKVGTTTYYYGGWTTAGCTERSSTHTGKYEWEEGVEKGGFTTAMKTAPITFESALNRTKVTCTGESGNGSITGRKTLGGIVFTFTGCSSNSQPCTTAGLGSGELRTTSLEGELGVEGQTVVNGKEVNHLGIDMFPPAHSGPVVEYSCGGGEAQTLSGSVIAPVASNKMFTTATLKFSQTAGLQKPEAFETGAKDVLTTAIGEQTGLALNSSLHTEEAIEINASVEPGPGA